MGGFAALVALGSSPRMRGALAHDAAVVPAVGIIPAYAGSTFSHCSKLLVLRDHPRVCGEHFCAGSMRAYDPGSSPRMRGALAGISGITFRCGIIPAYAGSTGTSPASRRRPRDHPRVCGEHFQSSSSAFSAAGSSPRMRGARARDRRHLLVRGIIPAYAGSTWLPQGNGSAVTDHPRVCGEHEPYPPSPEMEQGSSPRMRGAPASLKSERFSAGIIPAYAGSTTRLQSLRPMVWDHPRVCGEHHRSKCQACHSPGSSPRMRGAHTICLNQGKTTGIIPAYAGSTLKNPSSESRNPIIELHFNQFAKKVKRCFTIRFRPMRCFVFKIQ